MGNTTISKELLQNLIDSAAKLMGLITEPTTEQNQAMSALHRDINAVINAVTQTTASSASFAGSEVGGSRADAAKSSFI